MKMIFKRADAFRHPPAAVLFDTDNTLYPYDPAHKAAMDAVRAKATRLFGIEKEKFDEAFGIARNAIKERLRETASSHSRLLYFQRMLEIMGLGSQVLLALDMEQTYWRTFLANAKLFEGVKELLDDLRIAGIPTAIVTDLTAQIQFRKVVYFGLDHYFDYIVTSEESGCDKPHPAPFEIAIQKMQPKGECIWMIGDNPKTDIGGARRAINAVTIQKIHPGVVAGTAENEPDGLISSFQQLRLLLARLVNEQAGKQAN
jgi:putative hydrolase of the HAD superfamily